MDIDHAGKMLLRCTRSHGELICSGVNPLISYKCWEIYTVPDWYRWNEGRNIFLFHCPWRTVDDPRETAEKESSCVCFMFTFSRHMERKSKCFDLWTYSEYDLNHNALLDQLMYVNIEIYMVCWFFPPK